MKKTDNTPQSNEKAFAEQQAKKYLDSLKGRIGLDGSTPPKQIPEALMPVISCAANFTSAILGNPFLMSTFFNIAVSQRGIVAGSGPVPSDLNNAMCFAIDAAFKAALQFDVRQNELDKVDYRQCSFLMPAPTPEQVASNGKSPIIQP